MNNYKKRLWILALSMNSYKKRKNFYATYVGNAKHSKKVKKFTRTQIFPQY